MGWILADNMVQGVKEKVNQTYRTDGTQTQGL